MKYCLLQAPITEGECNAQIVILDLERPMDKCKSEHLLEQGYNFVGWLESDVDKFRLKDAFAYDISQKLEKVQAMCRSAAMELDEVWKL